MNLNVVCVTHTVVLHSTQYTHNETRFFSFTIGIFNITDALRSEVNVSVHFYPFNVRDVHLAFIALLNSREDTGCVSVFFSIFGSSST